MIDGFVKSSELLVITASSLEPKKRIQNPESRRKTKISQFELFGDELTNQVPWKSNFCVALHPSPLRYDKYASSHGIRTPCQFYKIWWSFLLCHQKPTFYESIMIAFYTIFVLPVTGMMG